MPVTPPYRLSRLISQITSMEGRAAIVVEIARPSPSATPQQLAELAKRAVAAVRGGGRRRLAWRERVAPTARAFAGKALHAMPAALPPAGLV